MVTPSMTLCVYIQGDANGEAFDGQSEKPIRNGDCTLVSRIGLSDVRFPQEGRRSRTEMARSAYEVGPEQNCPRTSSVYRPRCCAPVAARSP